MNATAPLPPTPQDPSASAADRLLPQEDAASAPDASGVHSTRRRWFSWRGLAYFWLVVLAFCGGGAATLLFMAPPGSLHAPSLPLPGALPGTKASHAAAADTAAPPAPATADSVAGHASEHASAEAAPLEPAANGPDDPALRPAVAGLLEPGPDGPLPRIATDGRMPMRYYARPFDSTDQHPRIALLIGGLGLNQRLSANAINRLPPAIGLAFSPYAQRLGPFVEQARLRGMESFIALPLEPQNYPAADPGEHALLTGLPQAENTERLNWVLSRFAGYVGVVNALGQMRGERFAQMPALYGGLQDALRQRGVLFIDARPDAPAPARYWGASARLVLDEPATGDAISHKLEQLEQIARDGGVALGFAGDVSPVVVDKIVAWAASLPAKGLVLAPVSALVSPPSTSAAQR